MGKQSIQLRMQQKFVIFVFLLIFLTNLDSQLSKPDFLLRETSEICLS